MEEKLAAKAVTKFARISAFKAREVTRAIQGLRAVDALERLEFYPKKAARLIFKTLHSAVANAENNNNLRREDLIVKEATVGEGPTLKRFQPKARGSAGPIRKRTSHVRIILTEAEAPAEAPAKKARAKSTKSKATETAASASAETK